MDRQRILREAQKIAAKFSFWMVSGNIAHLFGYVYETPDVKYELEVKFDDNFPNSPPQLIFHDPIKDLLSPIHLESLDNWNSESSTIDIIHELKSKIQDVLQEPVIIEGHPIDMSTEDEYITPDFSAYPSDFQKNDFITPSNVFGDSPATESSSDTTSEPTIFQPDESTIKESETFTEDKAYSEAVEPSVAVNTEISLIQQSYAYDQRSNKKADINVYLTITISQTFLIGIDFTKYPKLPKISLPIEVKNMLGEPSQFLNTLKKWNVKKPPHIVDVITELEIKLFFIQDIEQEAKKILGEYQCDKIPNSATQLKVHLLTYGFKEYLLDIDLGPYPKIPIIDCPGELQQLIQIPIRELNSIKNWKEKQSEPVEIIREISWLVDKNSRINFEIVLLKDHYKEINYDTATSTLRIDMKGKMRSQDMTFQFQIILPREYPLKLPEIKVINEFELESHEKLKNNLQSSFKSFFDEWTPFTYLVDLFDTISKKIFEVSVVSCVICHKIECPSCNSKIAGTGSCNAECPHCERAYHKHCWDQTLTSFGKCGFCLRTPF